MYFQVLDTWACSKLKLHRYLVLHIYIFFLVANVITEIWGSYCGEYEVQSLLEITLSSIVALMMEAASISETSVKFYGTTRRKISEGGHIYFNNFG
jgi:hypothetical protein